MSKFNLNDEICERLLSELSSYTLNEEYTQAALKKLKEELESIVAQSNEQEDRVAYKDYRHKSRPSFVYKIFKNISDGKDLTYDDMHDIVGTRLTCLTISDVYRVRDLIKENSDIKVLEEKDYIANPKKSGYKSYHMIVEVPIETEEGTKGIKSEIQLRTILMDIYAREEHKIRYKGHCTLEDGVILERLSNSLSLYDWIFENSFEYDKIEKTESSEESLKPYRDTFDLLSGLYGDLHDKFEGFIKDLIDNYDGNKDVLHFESRIKPLESIKRKIIKKGLHCTAEDMLYNINDVLGFKVVCTDLATAKDFTKKLIEKINSTEYLDLVKDSNHLDKPKEETGYRGYKLGVGFNMPLTPGKPIQFEILIRTLFMDAWTLHHDNIYKNEKAKAKYSEPFKRISDELYAKEDDMAKLKGGIVEKGDDQLELYRELKEYKANKVRKLSLQNKQKTEE